MCGIAGFSLFHHPEGDTSHLEKMGKAIAHRGPDAADTYINEFVGLCHRRLSIIDLSDAGTQPMFYDEGRLAIVFNGEIYNFQTLRAELESEGMVFQSHTDTEVILALYLRYGEQCVEKLNGMFAFALWDSNKQSLFIARDRLGKKPLYYFSHNGRFAFASEIKALLELDSVPRDIRLDAVYDFFAYQYVPDPKSIFKYIHKLPAGHTLTLSRDGIDIRQYWDVSFAKTIHSSEAENKQTLLNILEQATKQRMVSDVPLGAFLSGGVDSSGVVALMAQTSPTPVKTCTIGFDDPALNEAEFAKTIAQHYGTEHHEFILNQHVEERLDEIVKYFDEPFADPSLVPTFFVSELARQAVTVAIAGDGGDEMFAGYEKYTIDHIENQLRDKIPKPLRQNVFPSLAKFASLVPGSLGKKANSLLTSLSATPAMGFYMTNSQLTDKQWQTLVKPEISEQLGDYHPSELTLKTYESADGPDHLSKILYTDIKTYLCGGILVKVDRMSMANSLEVRAPILDFHVAEFAASLPSNQKYKNGDKKYLLKKAFNKFIPQDLLDRKKMGFSVPLASWLRNELFSIASERLLNPDSGLSQVFKLDKIEVLWIEHQSKKHDHSALLWSMLMYEMWYGNYIAKSD